MNIKNDKINIGINTLSFLAKICFVIGFMFVGLYFFDIKYFPIVSDYGVLLNIILFVACAAIFIFIIILACFILAPLNWIKLLSMPDVIFWWNKKNPAIFDGYNAGKFNFNFNMKLRIMMKYIIYISMYLIIFNSVIYYAKPKSNLLFLFSIINLILFFIGLIFPSGDDFKKNVISTLSLKEKIIIYIKIICISSSSGFSLFIGISLIGALIAKNSLFYKYISSWGYFIPFSLIVVCGSAICLFAPKNESISHKAWMLGFGTIFIAVICYLGNLSLISSFIMSDLKLGNITSTLEVDYVACQAFSWAHYPIKCNPKKGYYFIENVNSKWRSGEYYITFKSGAQTNEIIIPQVHIIAVLNPKITDIDNKK